MYKIFSITLLSLFLFSGCGGGGSSQDTGPIDSISGTWEGGMTFTLLDDASEVHTYHMRVILVETGSSVTGTYELFDLESEQAKPSAIHSGSFFNTTRTENQLNGFLINLSHDRGTPFFDTPLQFTASIANLSISGEGLTSMDGEGWTVTFTITLVSSGF